MQEFMVDVEHDIALNLVQDIKKAKLEDLPELHRYLTDQVAKCFDKDVYEDLLEDLNRILNRAGTEKTDLKTDIGRQLFEQKLLIPKRSRYDLLKKDM
jgi:3-deoxy-D-arabino-heptulosonate 7-phosphate (DAHP) synthase class II